MASAPDLEQEHVRDVYESIADHFSNTRYKAWPVVDKFFQSLKKGSIGLDVGCGNGKNMLIRNDVITIGCWNLLEICATRSLETVYGNMLTLPFRSHQHDFVISIAAIHHLATDERRKEALREMVRVTKPGENILVFAWALEQPQDSSLYKHPLNYVEEGNEQDVLVPWLNKKDSTLHHRYYHLFRKGELESLSIGLNVQVVESGYDRDNWYAIFQKCPNKTTRA